jgi:lipid-A-disaccharide synthase-like uncharacterized protein
MTAELAGIIGGVLFFASWVYQAWETRKMGQAVVSYNFFLMRLIGSILLLYEAIRVKSVSLVFVIAGTILLIIYNMYVIKFKKERKNPPRPKQGI